MTDGDRADPDPRWRRRLAALGIVWLAALLLLTLRPSTDIYTGSPWCVFCDDRGIADALLNVALFAPLGIIGRLCGFPLLTVAACGAALSTGIEAIQFFVPGRDAAIGDVLSNGFGAGLGGILAPHLRTLFLPARRSAARLTLAWAAAFLAAGLGSAWLLQPRVHDARTELEIRPRAPLGGYFEGEILGVSIDGTSARDGTPVAWSPEADTRLEVLLATAKRRVSLRPLIALRDENARYPLMFGPKEDDLVLRIARPANRLRLTAPDLKLVGVFEGVPIGARVAAVARREGDATCLRLDSEETCGLGFTIGSGWALLLPPEWIDGARARWMDGVWLAALLLPLGYWHARGGPVWPLAAILLYAVFFPPVSHLLGAMRWTLPGILTGWGLGRLTGGLVTARLEDRRPA